MKAWGYVFLVWSLFQGIHASANGRTMVVQLNQGLGTTQEAVIWGRVLKEKGPRQLRPQEKWWRQLWRSWSEWETDEVPHCSLTASVLGKQWEARTDAEGLFRISLKGPLPVGQFPITAKVGANGGSHSTPAQLRVFPSAGGTAVISDIDDTIMDTGIGNFFRMVRYGLFSNAYELKAFQGAAACYRRWEQKGYPIVFVSAGAHNLFPRLSHFLNINHFPPAPILLKNLGLAKGSDSIGKNDAYKLRRLEEIKALLPSYRFILVGDSGQHDPEIYRHFQKKYPEAVKEVLIHRVTLESKQSPRFTGQRLFDTYPELTH